MKASSKKIMLITKYKVDTHSRFVRLHERLLFTIRRKIAKKEHSFSALLDSNEFWIYCESISDINCSINAERRINGLEWEKIWRNISFNNSPINEVN